MEIGTLRSEPRQPGGRRANARLRRRGMVPAIIYGHKETPEAAAVSRHDLELALEHKAHVVQLSGGDGQLLLKDVQFDHLNRTPIHVDLLRVHADERVRVKVPLELRGTPAGTHEGGVLVQVMAELEVECLLTKIPESIRANVSGLTLGQALHVRELELPEGVRVLHGPDEIVAAVKQPRGPEAEPVAAPEAGEAQAKEPELIGRVAKPAEEEEEGGD